VIGPRYREALWLDTAANRQQSQPPHRGPGPGGPSSRHPTGTGNAEYMSLAKAGSCTVADSELTSLSCFWVMLF
jgi:hypothetical protein